MAQRIPFDPGRAWMQGQNAARQNRLLDIQAEQASAMNPLLQRLKQAQIQGQELKNQNAQDKSAQAVKMRNTLAMATLDKMIGAAPDDQKESVYQKGIQYFKNKGFNTSAFEGTTYNDMKTQLQAEGMLARNMGLIEGVTPHQERSLDLQERRLNQQDRAFELQQQRIDQGNERLDKTFDPEVNENLEFSKSKGKTLGKAEGQAILDLPQAIQAGDYSMGLIDQALQHPGLEAATGASSKADPRNYIPGTDAYNFRVLMDQISGQTFLEAFKSLKGGGQITETEGKKAEQAIARLDRAQSTEEFVKALNEFKGILSAGIEKAKNAASKQAQQAPNNDFDLEYDPATGTFK